MLASSSRDEILPRVKKKDKERSLRQDRTQGTFRNTGQAVAYAPEMPDEERISQVLATDEPSGARSASGEAGNANSLALRAMTAQSSLFVRVASKRRP